MSLDYEKSNDKIHKETGFWTSYADLATVLSVLFLMMYVLAVLRSTTITLSERSQVIHAQEQIKRLEQQLQVYEDIKREYLTTDAAEKERQKYEELMSYMRLLEKEAKQEKEILAKKSKENGIKERGLNHYQAMISQIINANLLAQSNIKKRDSIIAEKSKSLDELSMIAREKEQQIQNNTKEIGLIQAKLEQSIQQVQNAYKFSARSKKKMQDHINKLKAESSVMIQSLKDQNQIAGKQLAQTRIQLSEQSKALEAKESKVKALESEKAQIMGDLAARRNKYESDIGNLKQQYLASIEIERKTFEDSLAREKMGAQEKLTRERSHRRKMELEKIEYESKLADLGKKLDGTQKEIEKKDAQFKEAIDGLARSNQGLERELAGFKEKENARKELAQRIGNALRPVGVKADIDSKTGDVLIHFGKEYFDYGSAEMKDGMASILKRAIPSYASALLSDPKISQNIASVEIIGFASPTYRGRYINPRELSSEARGAVNYNMDLSYQRAKSIFAYVFDTKQMRYSFQRDLLALSKVSGQSYLKAQGAKEPGTFLSDDEYCIKYDCTKSQKVLIKFNFHDNAGDTHE